MSGILLSANAAPPTSPPPPPSRPPTLYLSMTGTSEQNVAGASGDLSPFIPSVRNPPGNPQDRYGWSTARASGSSKLAVSHIGTPSASAGPPITIRWTGLVVGEQVQTYFWVYASLPGYESEGYLLTAIVRRLS